MADDKNHMRTVAGKAMIYRTRLVKLHKRKKLPINPKASENPLSISSLFDQQDFENASVRQNIPFRIRNRDSIVIRPFRQLSIIRKLNPPLGDKTSNRQ
jgi:hypothetical protein